MSRPCAAALFDGVDGVRKRLVHSLLQETARLGLEPAELQNYARIDESVEEIMQGKTRLTVPTFNALALTLGMSLDEALPISTPLSPTDKGEWLEDMKLHFGSQVAACGSDGSDPAPEALIYFYIRLKALEELAETSEAVTAQ